MSEKWLFGAEVNRIQDTLFRANLQRQVVGGSYLLKLFGEQAKAKAKELDKQAEVLIHAGGNFRIIFSNKDAAQQFGSVLANAYHQLLDGMMTIAEPEKLVKESEFPTVNKALAEKLARQKRSQAQAASQPHLPTTAFCDSSGMGLANHYRRLIENGEPPAPPVYLSHIAWRKKEVGYLTKKGQTEFLQEIQRELPIKYQKWDWIDRAEEAADFDPSRRNVAYLVADGNNMGQLFGECATPDELKELSRSLQTAVRCAIAATIPSLIEATGAGQIPILPLIMAGDDIFILLPAPCALDFARQFNLKFEERLGQSPIVQQIRQRKGFPPPTMAAGIVFCKWNYPYLLAHKRGTNLEKATKRVIKSVGADGGGWHSAVSFTLLLGSEMVSDEAETGAFRSYLTTYWTTEKNTNLSEKAQAAALDVQTLFEQKQRLDNPQSRLIPHKRLAELRALYAPEQVPQKIADLYDRWQPQYEQLMERITASDKEKKQRPFLEETLTALGDAESNYTGFWKQMTRSGELFHAHGLADLLRVWPYAEPFPHLVEWLPPNCSQAKPGGNE